MFRYEDCLDMTRGSCLTDPQESVPSIVDRDCLDPAAMFQTLSKCLNVSEDHD